MFPGNDFDNFRSQAVGLGILGWVVSIGTLVGLLFLVKHLFF